VLVLVIVLAIAAAILVGAFARLVALRRQWRDTPPPTYSKPYRRWDDDERR
jgi:uncharacterized protein YneF (UPF0154 family)